MRARLNLDKNSASVQLPGRRESELSTAIGIAIAAAIRAPKNHGWKQNNDSMGRWPRTVSALTTSWISGLALGGDVS